MKKTMIALAAVASIAFAAKGDNDYSDRGWSGTSFEGYSVGATFNPNHDDDNIGGGKLFWNWGTDNIGDSYITNSADIGSYSGGHPAHAPNTTTSNYVSNAKALVLDTEGERFYRYMNSGDNVIPGTSTNAPVAIGAGIYFDSVVQFTASSDAPQIADGDKLVVWLHGIDADDTVTPAITGSTNLVITAGYLTDGANTVTPSNYVVTVNGSTPVEADTWHRLTIKAIESIGEGETNKDPIPGFVVFIDGVPVTNPEEKGVKESSYGEPHIIEDYRYGIADGVPSYWKTRNALFPSMVNSPTVIGGEEIWTLQAVGFAGTGKIDDIYFTEIAPEFTAEGKGVTLSWADEGVTGVTYQVGSGAVASAVNGAFIDMGSETTIAITALYDTANGYGKGDWVLNDYATEVADDTYTISGPGAIEIVALQRPYKVGGNTYADLGEAVSAAGEGGVVQLVGNLTTMFSTDSEMEDDFILDLNGKSIVVNTDGRPAVDVDSGTKLVIIDSVGGGYIQNLSSDYNGVYVVGELTVGFADGTTDKGATFESSIGVHTVNDVEVGKLTIVRAKIKEDEMDEETIRNYKADGSVLTLPEPGTHYLVEPGTVVKYAITISQGTGTTLAVAQGATPVASGGEVEEGSTVTLTAALETGYKNLVVTTNGVEVSGELDSEGKFSFHVNDAVTVASSATALNKPTVTVTGTEHVTTTWQVNGGTVTGDPPATLTEGDTLVFTVIAKDGDYTLTDVKINGDSQTTGGNYEYTVGVTEEEIRIEIVTTGYSSDTVSVTVDLGYNVSASSAVWTTNSVTLAETPTSLLVGSEWTATYTADDGYQFSAGVTTWSTNGTATADEAIVVIVPDATQIPPTPTDPEFDGGDGATTFTIPSGKIADLEAAAGGKSLGAVCDTSSGLTYAQAYALGLYDETEGFSNLPALTITATGSSFSVAFADGISPKNGYSVVYTVETKDALTDASWTPVDGVTTLPYIGSTSTAGFFRVKLVVSGAEVTE